jgi:hypothetical protein
MSADDAWAVGFGLEDFHGRIVHWDGVQWNDVPSPRLDAKNIGLADVAGVSPHDLWASGVAFPKDTDAVSHPVMEHWDGSKWAAVTLPPLAEPRGDLGQIAVVSSDDVWAAGSQGSQAHIQPLIEHWDGSAWNVVPVTTHPRIGPVAGIVAAGHNDVWIVGKELRDNPGSPNGPTPAETFVALHWTGTTWERGPVAPFGPSESRLASSSDALPEAMVEIDPDDIWVVGDWEPARWQGKHIANGQQVPLFMHWDGKIWSQASVTDPAPVGEAHGVDGRSADDIWAVGWAQGSPTSRPTTYHWDGHAWTEAPSPSVGVGPQHGDDFRTNELGSVSIAPSGSGWAVGQFAVGKGNDERLLVERLCPSGRPGSG